MGLTRVRAEQISDIDYKQAVRVITLTNITLTIGAPSQVDSVNLSQGDRILVAGQATASENGIYRVDAVGTGSNGTWVRSDDANVTGEIQAGMIVMITEGTIWKDTSWKLTTNNPITIGTTALTFVQNTGDSYSIIIANNTSIIANAVSSAITFTSGNNFSIVGNAAADTVTFAVDDAPTFAGNVTASYFIGNGSQLTGIASSSYGNSNVANYLNSGITGNIIPSANNVYSLGSPTAQWASVYVSANTLYLGNVAVSSNANGLVVSGNTVVTADPNGTSTTTGNVSITGNISSSNLSVSTGTITVGNIVNANGNGVGNIGSSSNYFNTVFAQSTSAVYADLAEMYCADIKYPPGTVVEFGGDFEVTKTSSSHSTAVAGVVSTNPSYLMNATLDCSTAIEIALVGRVPCFVVGTIRKGDRLVSSNVPGVATALDITKYQPGCIVGKSLENYDSETVGVIEVGVGRM